MGTTYMCTVTSDEICQDSSEPSIVCACGVVDFYVVPVPYAGKKTQAEPQHGPTTAVQGTGQGRKRTAPASPARAPTRNAQPTKTLQIITGQTTDDATQPQAAGRSPARPAVTKNLGTPSKTQASPARVTPTKAGPPFASPSRTPTKTTATPNKAPGTPQSPAMASPTPVKPPVKKPRVVTQPAFQATVQAMRTGHIALQLAQSVSLAKRASGTVQTGLTTGPQAAARTATQQPAFQQQGSDPMQVDTAAAPMVPMLSAVWPTPTDAQQSASLPTTTDVQRSAGRPTAMGAQQNAVLPTTMDAKLNAVWPTKLAQQDTAQPASVPRQMLPQSAAKMSLIPRYSGHPAALAAQLQPAAATADADASQPDAENVEPSYQAPVQHGTAGLGGPQAIVKSQQVGSADAKAAQPLHGQKQTSNSISAAAATAAGTEIAANTSGPKITLIKRKPAKKTVALLNPAAGRSGGSPLAPVVGQAAAAAAAPKPAALTRGLDAGSTSSKPRSASAVPKKKGSQALPSQRVVVPRSLRSASRQLRVLPHRLAA